MGRVVLLGIDGGTWKALDYLTSKKVMPCLQELKRRYGFGVCESVIPSMTPPAWTSFLTGVYPGKHGIFGFSYKPVNSYNYTRIYDRRDIQYPSMDRILSYYGKKSILVNIPMTYPPSTYTVACISGMMTPSEKANYMFPPSLGEKLKAKGINYRIDYPFRGKPKGVSNKVKKDHGKSFLEELMDIESNRAEAVFYLMEEYEWDVFAFALTMSDRLQHHLWNYLFLESSPDKKLTQNIWAFYRRVDSILGKVLARLQKEDKLLIFSDHGFERYLGDFNVNRWLMEKGYLRKRNFWEAGFRYLLKRLGLWEGCCTIDYANSKAYIANVNSINVNLQGREKEGKVGPEEYTQVLNGIRENLLKLEYRGEKVIKEVYLGEELYGGGKKNLDLFYEFKEEYLCHGYGMGIRNRRIIIEKSWKQADHIREGIFLMNEEMASPPIKLSLVDILPLTLSLTGCKIPHFIQGKVPEHIKKKYPVEIDYKFPLGEEEIQDEGRLTDNQELLDRLKSLGYI